LNLWFETAPDVADVACWFTAASRWHSKGSYGATDDAMDLNVPKVQAIAEVSAKHPHEPAGAAPQPPAPDPAPGTQPGKAESLKRAIDDVEAATQKLREAEANWQTTWDRLKETAATESTSAQ
jgi:hypothetical protein